VTAITIVLMATVPATVMLAIALDVMVVAMWISGRLERSG
jgi:hypothetical protein